MGIEITAIVWIAVIINAVAALSFYVPYAAGTFNVSQAGFMLVGAYSVGVGTTAAGLPVWLAIIVGVVISVPISWALALATARLDGIYLAMATLAFVFVTQQIVVLIPVLGGAVGVYGIANILTWPVAVAALVLIAGFVALLMRTRFGFEMRLTREDVVTARATGINVRSVRIRTMIISAVLASLAGAMYALSSSFVGPTDFGFALQISIVSWAIVGGTDRWWGPLLGATLLTLLPEFTQSVSVVRDILSGALLLIVLVLFPEGLVGVVLRIIGAIRRGRDRRRGRLAKEMAGAS